MAAALEGCGSFATVQEEKGSSFFLLRIVTVKVVEVVIALVTLSVAVTVTGRSRVEQRPRTHPHPLLPPPQPMPAPSAPSSRNRVNVGQGFFTGRPECRAERCRQAQPLRPRSPCWLHQRAMCQVLQVPARGNRLDGNRAVPCLRWQCAIEVGEMVIFALSAGGDSRCA